RVGILQASTSRKHEVIVLIEVVDGTEVEPRTVLSINGVGGLMEYFPADSECVGHLSLKQEPSEPKIFVTHASSIDPIAATTIDGPIAEALLKPQREKHLDMAYP